MSKNTKRSTRRRSSKNTHCFQFTGEIVSVELDVGEDEEYYWWRCHQCGLSFATECGVTPITAKEFFDASGELVTSIAISWRCAKPCEEHLREREF